MAENPRKLYYSIKEVAQQINVTESLLRYWETEFPHLRPKTTGNRVRQYTEKDIEQIKVIYNLVKVRGFKIAAARKMLQENRSGADKSQKVMETLFSVRDQLKELKKTVRRIGIDGILRGDVFKDMSHKLAVIERIFVFLFPLFYFCF